MKRRVGAPKVLERAYHRGLCQTVIEVGRKGGTTNAMAKACGVYTRTIHYWKKTRPEFAYAFDRAKNEAQAYWEDVGKANMDNPNFNVGVWLFIMRRFEVPYFHRKPAPPVAAIVGAVRSIVRDQEPLPPE